MKIGMIGLGMVGDTTYQQIKDRFEIKKYDPAKGFNDELGECEIIFISVPVNTKISGGQNLSIFKESINRCPDGSLIFVRSTVLPGTCDKLNFSYPDKIIIHMPEFFTERTRLEDAAKFDIVCGRANGFPETELISVLADLFPGKAALTMLNIEAEITKYAHNCFGALKVEYWNQINDICQKNGADYKTVRDAALMSGYINKMHTDVPGPDKFYGFGGACFPKDILAFGNYERSVMLQNASFKNMQRRGLEKMTHFIGIED